MIEEDFVMSGNDGLNLAVVVTGVSGNEPMDPSIGSIQISRLFHKADGGRLVYEE